MVRNFAAASGRQVSPVPRGVERTRGAPCPRQSAIRRSATANRPCTAVSRGVNPTTFADRARKACPFGSKICPASAKPFRSMPKIFALWATY